MKLIVGLGNYGDKYSATYHNMGFMVADCLGKRLNIKVKTLECDAVTGVGSIGGEKIIIAKPMTYMNLSGRAVKQLMKKYDVDKTELIVVFDDIDIEKGTIRVRLEGSGGTHNGMRNIIEEICDKGFARVRVGIGKPEGNIPLADYVLSVPKMSDRALIEEAIEKAADEVIKLVST